VLYHGAGDYVDLVSCEFEAETEADVKVQVEAWVQARFDELRKLVAEFYHPEPSR
jgi:hypothetical protein